MKYRILRSKTRFMNSINPESTRVFVLCTNSSGQQLYFFYRAQKQILGLLCWILSWYFAVILFVSLRLLWCLIDKGSASTRWEWCRPNSWWCLWSGPKSVCGFIIVFSSHEHSTLWSKVWLYFVFGPLFLS